MRISSHYRTGLAVLLALTPLVSVASNPRQSPSASTTEAVVEAMPLDCNPEDLPHPQSEQCRVRRRLEGRRLFEDETFGGNGRTCATCHSRETGTIAPQDVRARLAANPGDPLFVHDGLDDGIAGTSRIEQHATVRITLPLPSHLTLPGDPAETHVTFNRGTPTTQNTPALDPALMVDLRAADLKVQAFGAIRDHTQNAIDPTDLELELIAEFQRTVSRFFSDGRLKKFAKTGVAPELPDGTTDSEKRGRLFFVDAPFQPPSKVGACALCHSGPMLNEANVFSTAVFGNPPGARAFSVGVSEANFIGNPTRTFLVHDGLGNPVPVTTPDIGILMTDVSKSPIAAQTIPPPFVLQQFGLRLAFFANVFKTPTLWGVKNTAPYFHDNSAKDFDDMLKQYDWFFLNFVIGNAITLTPQDKKDIKAFLNLL